MPQPRRRHRRHAPHRGLALWLLSGLLLGALGACSRSAAGALAEREGGAAMPLHADGPADFADWMHSPMRPLDGEPLAFTLEATAAAPGASVELHVFEYELYRDRDGRPAQRRRPGGTWGLLRRWAADDLPGRRLRLAAPYAAGFGPHTRVEYVWRVVEAGGAISDRFARFDAGTSPWPEDKVLLYSASRRPMGQTIDLAFFRDVDYRDSLALYRSDVESMVREGFLSASSFGASREHWAFYTTDRSADGAAISADIGNQALIPTFLKDFSIPGVDAFCLLHRESYTDRSLLTENFHALSNNLFSAEAYNHGTAVHECGHAIFHLSDEYGGCACFQTHAASNVFREAADCAEWNRANGFPAESCFELRDLYDRSWFSAEEPAFFATREACRDHNLANGLSPDSCRTFIDIAGEVKHWAFGATCIMHDDGDDLVRPFRRACARVIDGFYETLAADLGTLASLGSTPGSAASAEAGAARYENVFGYEPVLEVAMHRNGADWSVAVEGARYGVPTSATLAGGEVTMRILGVGGVELASYHLAEPGAVHRHGDEDAFRVPEVGTVRISVPASGPRPEFVTCDFDRGRAGRSAGGGEPTYRQGFVFDVAAAAAQALQGL